MQARPARRRDRHRRSSAGELHRDGDRQPHRWRCCSAACSSSSCWSPFLFEWRTALISLIAIPLSLMAAVLVLYLRGDTINTMMLAGLVIALGVVVDDAIIDVENIWRRLRERRRRAGRARTARIILEASLEVRSAIVYATLIIVARRRAGVLPASLTGLVLPAARALLRAGGPRLDGRRADGHAGAEPDPAAARRVERGDPPLVRWLKRGYARRCSRHRSARPRPGVRRGRSRSSLAGVARRADPRREPVPGVQGAGLPDALDHGARHLASRGAAHRHPASRELRAIPGVRNFGSHIGQAFLAEEIAGVNFGENWISIDRDADYDKTLAAIEEVVDSYPGPVPRRADLPERAHRRGAGRAPRADRGAHLRRRTSTTLSSQADAGRGALSRHRRASTTCTSSSRPTCRRSRSRRTSPRRSATASSPATSAARRRRSMSSEEVGDIFRGGRAYDVHVWSTPEHAQQPRPTSATCRSTPRRRPRPAGRRRHRAGAPDAERRSTARTPRGASTSPRTSADRDLGDDRRATSATGSTRSVPAGLPRRAARRGSGAARARRTGCCSSARRPALGIFLLLQAAFREPAPGGAVLPDPADGAGRRRAGGAT